MRKKAGKGDGKFQTMSLILLGLTQASTWCFSPRHGDLIKQSTWVVQDPKLSGHYQKKV